VKSTADSVAFVRQREDLLLPTKAPVVANDIAKSDKARKKTGNEDRRQRLRLSMNVMNISA
jgi:hypothetical protein